MSGKCAKCKTCPREGSDSWCLGCSSWESIGRDLCGKWEVPAGIRQVANSLAVNCACEIRALRGLGAGIRLAQGSGAGARVKEEKTEPPTLPKETPPGLSAKAKATPQEYSDYTFEEEEESEEESAPLAPPADPRPSLPRARPRAEPVLAGPSSGAGLAEHRIAVRGEEREEEREKKPWEKQKKDWR